MVKKKEETQESKIEEKVNEEVEKKIEDVKKKSEEEEKAEEMFKKVSEKDKNRDYSEVGSAIFPCPGCGKGKIKRDFHERQTGIKYKCSVCGFTGPN